MCINIAMICAIYHNIVQLLLLTIIVSSKNYMILIIGKENIAINKQNQLIVQPYSCFYHYGCHNVLCHILVGFARTDQEI